MTHPTGKCNIQNTMQKVTGCALSPGACRNWNQIHWNDNVLLSLTAFSRWCTSATSEEPNWKSRTQNVLCRQSSRMSWQMVLNADEMSKPTTMWNASSRFLFNPSQHFPLLLLSLDQPHCPSSSSNAASVEWPVQKPNCNKQMLTDWNVTLIRTIVC